MKQQELIKKLEKELFNRDILKSNGISEKDIKMLFTMEKMIKANHKFLYLFIALFSDKFTDIQIKKALVSRNDSENKLKDIEMLVKTIYDL